MRKFFCCISLLWPMLAVSQTPLSADIAATYDFKPSALSRDQQDKKIPALDALWEMVSAEPEKMLPALREELQQAGQPDFFYYDGAQLLLSLSAQRDDKQLALNAIAKCDPTDINGDDYVLVVNKLAVEQLDTRAAALNILRQQDFSAFFPLHSLTLNHDMALVFMLLPSARSEDYMALVTQHYDPAMASAPLTALLTLAWFHVSAEGDAFVRSVANDDRLSSDKRAIAKKALHAIESFPADRAPSENVETLKKRRREALRRVSDEALAELDSVNTSMRLLWTASAKNR